MGFKGGKTSDLVGGNMKKRKVIVSFLVVGLIITQLPLNIFTKDQHVNNEAISEEISEEKETMEIEEIPEDYEENDDEVVLGQANVTVLASEPSVEVGRVAQYQVYVNMDGRQIEYNDVHIQIQLPQEIDQNILFLIKKKMT